MTSPKYDWEELDGAEPSDASIALDGKREDDPLEGEATLEVTNYDLSHFDTDDQFFFSGIDDGSSAISLPSSPMAAPLLSHPQESPKNPPLGCSTDALESRQPPKQTKTAGNQHTTTIPSTSNGVQSPVATSLAPVDKSIAQQPNIRSSLGHVPDFPSTTKSSIVSPPTTTAATPSSPSSIKRMRAAKAPSTIPITSDSDSDSDDESIIPSAAHLDAQELQEYTKYLHMQKYLAKWVQQHGSYHQSPKKTSKAIKWATEQTSIYLAKPPTKRKRKRTEHFKFGAHQPRCLDDDTDNECSICGHGGDLIICSYCPCVYHLGCLNGSHRPNDPSDPNEDWRCPTCLDPTAAVLGLSSSSSDEEVDDSDDDEFEIDQDLDDVLVAEEFRDLQVLEKERRRENKEQSMKLLNLADKLNGVFAGVKVSDNIKPDILASLASLEREKLWALIRTKHTPSSRLTFSTLNCIKVYMPALEALDFSTDDGVDDDEVVIDTAVDAATQQLEELKADLRSKPRSADVKAAVSLIIVYLESHREELDEETMDRYLVLADALRDKESFYKDDREDAKVLLRTAGEDRPKDLKVALEVLASCEELTTSPKRKNGMQNSIKNNHKGNGNSNNNNNGFNIHDLTRALPTVPSMVPVEVLKTTLYPQAAAEGSCGSEKTMTDAVLLSKPHKSLPMTKKGGRWAKSPTTVDLKKTFKSFFADDSKKRKHFLETRVGWILRKTTDDEPASAIACVFLKQKKGTEKDFHHLHIIQLACLPLLFPTDVYAELKAKAISLVVEHFNPNKDQVGWTPSWRWMQSLGGYRDVEEGDKAHPDTKRLPTLDSRRLLKIILGHKKTIFSKICARTDVPLPSPPPKKKQKHAEVDVCSDSDDEDAVETVAPPVVVPTPSTTTPPVDDVPPSEGTISNLTVEDFRAMVAVTNMIEVPPEDHNSEKHEWLPPAEMENDPLTTVESVSVTTAPPPPAPAPVKDTTVPLVAPVPPPEKADVVMTPAAAAVAAVDDEKPTFEGRRKGEKRARQKVDELREQGRQSQRRGKKHSSQKEAETTESGAVVVVDEIQKEAPPKKKQKTTATPTPSKKIAPKRKRVTPPPSPESTTPNPVKEPAPKKLKPTLVKESVSWLDRVGMELHNFDESESLPNPLVWALMQLDAHHSEECSQLIKDSLKPEIAVAFDALNQTLSRAPQDADLTELSKQLFAFSKAHGHPSRTFMLHACLAMALHCPKNLSFGLLAPVATSDGKVPEPPAASLDFDDFDPFADPDDQVEKEPENKETAKVPAFAVLGSNTSLPVSGLAGIALHMAEAKRRGKTMSDLYQLCLKHTGINMDMLSPLKSPQDIWDALVTWSKKDALHAGLLLLAWKTMRPVYVFKDGDGNHHRFV